jgi:hypothetical protein
MAPHEQHDKKIDGPHEGERDSKTTQKVASEFVTAEQQAQPTQRFHSWSGTKDSKLTAARDGETPEQHRARQDAAALEVGKAAGQKISEFVIEDKTKGVEHTAKGERRVAQQPDAPPGLFQSFVQGLKKLSDGAKPADSNRSSEQRDAQPATRQSFIEGLKKLVPGSKGLEVSDAQKSEQSTNSHENQHNLRQSWIDGLKKYAAGAKTPEEKRAQEQKFSLDYALRKLGEWDNLCLCSPE